MMSRITRAATLTVAVLAALSCSKTSDTAPERRVFGDPPTIQGVDFRFDTQKRVSCNFTGIIFNYFCSNGLTDVQFITGTGCNPPFGDGKCTPAKLPSEQPGIFIQGTYTQAIFTAKVTDPQSVAGGKNDVLLVTSSYVQPPPSTSETSLVLFDDGKSLKFPIIQKVSGGVGEDCVTDLSTGVCTCASATYEIVSGDDTANDGTYTRKFAMPNNNDSDYFKDCIMQQDQENVDVPFPPASALSFKIEAVDREGNLATWPTRLQGTTGNDTFECTGDPCGCCFLLSSNPAGECAGLDGMLTGFYANGYCHFLNGT